MACTLGHSISISLPSTELVARLATGGLRTHFHLPPCTDHIPSLELGFFEQYMHVMFSVPLISISYGSNPLQGRANKTASNKQIADLINLQSLRFKCLTSFLPLRNGFHDQLIQTSISQSFVDDSNPGPNRQLLPVSRVPRQREHQRDLRASAHLALS